MAITSKMFEASPEAYPVLSRPPKKRVFLLSPANAAGVRARLILREQARFELATRLRDTGAPLGEIFGFISGLYFRGKLEYARAFAHPPANTPGVLIITASRGLLTPETVLNLDEFRKIALEPIHAGNARYREPLECDALQLSRQLCPGCEIVLLGSIATPKYVEPLMGIFGDDLMFPTDFVGRGDLSRGGLMLRSARQSIELIYTPVAGSLRQGAKPPKLSNLRSPMGRAKKKR
jgi:hypothetical protein